MAKLADLERELRQVQGRLMRWPRAARYIQQAKELTQAIEREREARARALRGQIRRALMGADAATLERMAAGIGCDREG